ncbi:MAG TPA: hypothetical protein VFC74_03335 [Oscillospiraceae bacterium]|nr:hypothetical protein [Oscillospiraceae bacterium]
MAEAKQVEYYLQAASEVNEKYGLEVKWQEILALDTVLLGQNFSQSSVERAKRLAAEFVQKEVVETEEVEAKGNVLYKQVSLDKVMAAYRLSSEQKDQVSLFLKMIGSREGVCMFSIIASPNYFEEIKTVITGRGSILYGKSVNDEDVIKAFDKAGRVNASVLILDVDAGGCRGYCHGGQKVQSNQTTYPNYSPCAWQEAGRFGYIPIVGQGCI